MAQQEGPAPEYRHVDIDGLDVAYLDVGEGPLILLLHGYPDTARGWLGHNINVECSARLETSLGLNPVTGGK